MNTKEFNVFKKKAIKFKVQENHLLCQNSKNVSMGQVVDNLTEWQTILKQLHDKSGHKRQEKTYQQIVD